MSKQRGQALSVLLGSLILYLGANALTGQDGLISHYGLQARERALRSELAALRERRDRLADRVARLSPRSLDLDYLEERARVLLGARRRGEIVTRFELVGEPAF